MLESVPTVDATLSLKLSKTGYISELLRGRTNCANYPFISPLARHDWSNFP